MTTKSKHHHYGRAKKGWTSLSLKISPQAKTRLMEHSQALGVEVGAFLNAFILGKLDPEPHYSLPPAPAIGGSSMLYWLNVEVKDLERRNHIYALLSQASATGPDVPDFLEELESNNRKGDLLRRCIRSLRGSYEPAEGMDALTWLHCKTIAQNLAEGMYEDCKRGQPKAPQPPKAGQRPTTGARRS